MMKSFYALLEQKLLLIEGEGRHILAKIARDRLSEKGTKTGGNVGNNQNLPHKYPTSTPHEPNKCPITLKQVVQTTPKAANKNTASPNWGVRWRKG